MPLHLSFAEYLSVGEGSPIRHEFVGGVVFAAVPSAALGQGCRPYIEGAKLRLDRPGGHVSVYYPDVMVACRPPDDLRWETFPCQLVEVLSPSTTVVDRREKLGAYLQIETLPAHLLVDPNSPFVEAHERIDGRWVSQSYGPGDTIAFTCPSVAFSIDSIFADLPAV